MRVVTDDITQWACGRYFLFWAGDEILLKADNDADAIAEGSELLKTLNQEDLTQ